MKHFMQFLRQPVPKQGKEIPLYYRRALVVSECMLLAYLLLCFFFYPVFCGKWLLFPLLLIAGTAVGLRMIRHYNTRANLIAFSVLCLGWVVWNIYAFGWNYGVQQFLTLLLVFVFFDIYEKPLTKIFCFAAILAVRILLFAWSGSRPAVYDGLIGSEAGTVYQGMNTVFFFLMLTVMCVAFSTNIQSTELELRIRNQALYKEAGTDALTGLPNRRAMIEEIERFRKAFPDQPFSVAIADIDFFKKVNDTYGHTCGDYTLVKLTELFRAHSGGQYSICRWGGEEFCLFMPGKNVDEAGILMKDLCFAVQRMRVRFEDAEFSITITIGVEECDFISPLEDLLKRADEKLYMGKDAGRNRVVV